MASERVWEMVARTPAMLTFAAGVSALVAPDALPGGSLPFFMGLVGVAVVARVVKLVAMSASGRSAWAMRPEVGLAPSPGFPSSHTAVMVFALVASIVDARVRQSARRISFAVIIGLLALLTGAARVLQSCHTGVQVAAGAVLGAAIGSLYAWRFVGRVPKNSPCL